MRHYLLWSVSLLVASCANTSGEQTSEVDASAEEVPSGAERQPDASEGHSSVDATVVTESEAGAQELSTSKLDADAPSTSSGNQSAEQASNDGASQGTDDTGELTTPIVTVPGCGDGAVGALEQCDDGNADSGDGCSNFCRVELGSKCEGAPSVCLLTVCGDGVREGAEGCDDGNAVPFDGCSSHCLSEPQCEPGAGCGSTCGDGVVVNEACDDGNTDSGDGCSNACEIEAGFNCLTPSNSVSAASCKVRAVHRDFAASQPDFGITGENPQCGIPEGDPIEQGIALDILDADGKPVLGDASYYACIESAETFAEWFRGGVEVADVLTLFDNTAGAYVNRFGAEGERYEYVLAGENEQLVVGATSPETCEPGCRQRAAYTLNCNAECALLTDERASANTQLGMLQAERDGAVDETEIAELDAQIAELEVQVASLTDEIETCETNCSAAIEELVPACVEDCKPCSFSPNGLHWCVGGISVFSDGTPLFFPVDHVTGSTRDVAAAQIPPEFGGIGWPLEEDVLGVAVEHNFSFTTEIRHWFRYNPDFTLNLVFMSDDDAFVFVNGKLALDLGGLHVPAQGAVTIGPPSAGDFGLLPGKVYEIAVFKAERKGDGSTFLFTLPPPVDLSPSVCVPG